MKVMLFHGLAVKKLATRVDTVLVAFEEAKKRLPKAKNIVITGTLKFKRSENSYLCNNISNHSNNAYNHK